MLPAPPPPPAITAVCPLMLTTVRPPPFRQPLPALSTAPTLPSYDCPATTRKVATIDAPAASLPAVAAPPGAPTAVMRASQTPAGTVADVNGPAVV